MQGPNVRLFKRRTVPGYAAVRGEADTNAFVTVNERPVARTSEFFHGGNYADNTLSNLYADLEIYAAINPSGTNTPDTVYSITTSVFVAKTPETFTYDSDGNMASDGRFTYTWNADNRLVCASNAEVVVTYAYDYRGRMVRKDIQRRGAEPQRVEYTWDGWNIVRETHVSRLASRVTHNVWGLDLDGTLQGAGGVGGLLAVIVPRPMGEGQDEGGTVYLPCYDANGNVTEYVSTDGEVVAHYDYSPFGEQLVASGPLAATFSHQFSTKPYCPVTGFSEYQMRKYRPDIGSWMSRDAIIKYSDYRLLQNNAISGIDFLGFSKIPHNTNIWVSGIPKTVEAYEKALADAIARGASKEHINAIRGGLKVLKRNVAQRGAVSYELLGVISAIGVGLSLSDLGVSIGNYMGAWGNDMPEVTIRHIGSIECEDPFTAIPTEIKIVLQHGHIYQRGILWGLGGIADYHVWFENTIEITRECICAPSGEYRVDYRYLSAPVSDSWLWGFGGSAFAMAYKEVLTLTLEE